MSITDKQFREQFKPLHIPAHYLVDDTEQNKIVYALAQIGQGTAQAVADELLKHDSALQATTVLQSAQSTLDRLFNMGLIKGDNIDNEVHYNLSKITQSNDGEVNPHLLAPGLD